MIAFHRSGAIRLAALFLALFGCAVVVAAMMATASLPALPAVALAAAMSLTEFWFRKGKTVVVPGLRSRVGGLRAQYQQILNDVASLRRGVEVAAKHDTETDYDDLRHRLSWLLTALRHQRSRESDLIYEAYYDIYTTAGNQAETLTGRTAIWTYVLNAAVEQPWIGQVQTHSKRHALRREVEPIAR